MKNGPHRIRSALSLSFSLALALALAGCKSDVPTPRETQLRLTRSTNGRIAVELVDSARSIRALQVELVVDGSAAFTLEEPEGPSGLPLDTVRLSMRGINRGILFAADKRGVLLPGTGVLATFAAHLNGTGSAQGAQLRIASAVVADVDGAPLEVALGPAISVR